MVLFSLFVPKHPRKLRFLIEDVYTAEKQTITCGIYAQQPYGVFNDMTKTYVYMCARISTCSRQTISVMFKQLRYCEPYIQEIESNGVTLAA